MRQCPHCQATTRQNRVGKTKAGSQRYHCMQCHRKYTLDPKAQRVSARVVEPPVRRRVNEGILHHRVPSLKAAFPIAVLRMTNIAKALRNGTLSFVKNEAFQPSQHAYASIEMH